MTSLRARSGDESEIPAVRITGPSGLVAAVPYLVGFAPVESVVVVLLTPPPRSVALSLRMDLDLGADTGVDAAVEVLGDALDRAIVFGTVLDRAHLVVFSEAAGGLPAEELIESLVVMLAERGVDVGEVISTTGDRRWCYTQQHPHPCPAEGHPLERSEMLAAQASLVRAGVGYLTSRSELVESIALDPDRALPAEALTRAKGERDARVRSGDGVGWRRLQEDTLWTAFDSAYDDAALASRGAAWAVALADSRVREPVLFRVLVGLGPSRRQELLAGARMWLSALVARAPGSDGGPVAATLAAVAWQQGDGAFARIAAVRALEAQPGNTLGELILAACSSGMPPREWIRVLASFGLHELRFPRPSDEAIELEPNQWSASA